MTEEQKANDANRYVVVREDSGEIFGAYKSEGEAKAKAEHNAAMAAGAEFIVYQKIGSAKLEPRVTWKGASR